jgi:hypothetical protein
MHSSACFRKLSDADTARLLETPTLKRCTASRVLSVVLRHRELHGDTGCTRLQEVTAVRKAGARGVTKATGKKEASKRHFIPPQSGRLTMAAPAHVFTISRAAEIQLLWHLALNMEPEDGCLRVYGTDGQHTMAFTQRGLEYLRELVAEHKRSTTPTRS